ncbi:MULTISPECIES: 4-hydroxy-tetrahydrodipicolinate synthase [Sphingobacterium]|uniref:4-hydroxy-tetrahydrodipicolinate synthase n=1 Tax=Sphingobacterium TaxID=28453 RepID=UPI00104D04D8|nr:MULTISPECIES: 4-hydroxy-tetrahydrodipicolinate synthase [Sphingobacterium]MCW2260511.1 4-hydroxy-tetrahydrodipicolinate synthase [Sphingobacterium kitahiroshimense]NJI71611.1 4-hydroxy-tetrahydrodipicolinate synthase [Sphingobacterium sp. B16(2022)]TCR00960.1 dihydrodipicolinate synthase [Sphingobacterium sp. JUb78]
MNELHGAGVALVTPFNADGTVDFDSLAQLIDYQIDSGMNYLVSLGTTGEVATLTKDERKRIWDFTVKQVNARVPLIAGIGGNNTAEIVEQIKNFDPTGFCAILSVSPYYNKPVQEGIYQHYKAIAEASPLPIILYNVPGRTGSNMTPATTIRLAKDFKNIVATKEASGNFAQFNEILRDKPADFLLISGDDPATLPMMALGAVGIISVVGNAYPAQVSKLAALCTAGSFTEARTIHNALLEITDLCFVEGNPCGVKYILQEKGIGQDYVRLPLIPVSANIQTAIKAEMQKLK